MSERGTRSGTPLSERRKNSTSAVSRRLMAYGESHGENGGGAQEESEEWVVSYMDMVTLLMIVFLTLVGMLWVDKKTRPTVVNVLQVEQSNLPRRNFQEPEPPPLPDAIARAAVRDSSQRDALGPPEPVLNALAPEKPLPPNVEIKPETRAKVEQMVQTLRQNGLEDQVSLQVQERKVSFAIRDRLLFASGQTEIQPAGQTVIKRLAAMLRSMPGVISVEGHTDSVPIHTDRFPSNWELSAGRAASVVHALVENGLPVLRLRAIGYADTRPLARGSDPESQAQNRRVTLVVEE